MSLKCTICKSYILIASLLCLALVQCKDFEDCRSLYSSQVSIKFLPNNKTNTSTFSYDSLVIAPNTLIYGKNVSENVQIPLNPAANSTTFYVYRSNPIQIVDTVTIFYQRYPLLISPQCGAQQKYVVDSLCTTFAKYSILNATPKMEKDKNQVDVEIFYISL